MFLSTLLAAVIVHWVTGLGVGHAGEPPARAADVVWSLVGPPGQPPELFVPSHVP